MHIVSIITDFGLQDYYVAELKAHIYERSPGVRIVDVSHSVDSHDIVQAAHFLDNIFRSFPKGSVHCVAVYNYYSRNSRFVTFERDGHYFVGPDNGVFSLIFDDLRPDQVYEIDQQLLGLDTISKVIGWTVGYLSKGNPIAEIGEVVTEDGYPARSDQFSDQGDDHPYRSLPKCHHQPQAGSVRATASWATLPDILQAD